MKDENFEDNGFEEDFFEGGKPDSIYKIVYITVAILVIGFFLILYFK